MVGTETSDEVVAAMVSAWLRLREGAPDAHALTAGLSATTAYATAVQLEKLLAEVLASTVALGQP